MLIDVDNQTVPIHVQPSQQRLKEKNESEQSNETVEQPGSMAVPNYSPSSSEHEKIAIAPIPEDAPDEDILLTEAFLEMSGTNWNKCHERETKTREEIILREYEAIESPVETRNVNFLLLIEFISSKYPGYAVLPFWNDECLSDENQQKAKLEFLQKLCFAISSHEVILIVILNTPKNQREKNGHYTGSVIDVKGSGNELEVHLFDSLVHESGADEHGFREKFLNLLLDGFKNYKEFKCDSPKHVFTPKHARQLDDLYNCGLLVCLFFAQFKRSPEEKEYYIQWDAEEKECEKMREDLEELRIKMKPKRSLKFHNDDELFESGLELTNRLLKTASK